MDESNGRVGYISRKAAEMRRLQHDNSDAARHALSTLLISNPNTCLHAVIADCSDDDGYGTNMRTIGHHRSADRLHEWLELLIGGLFPPCPCQKQSYLRQLFVGSTCAHVSAYGIVTCKVHKHVISRHLSYGI